MNQQLSSVNDLVMDKQTPYQDAALVCRFSINMLISFNIINIALNLVLKLYVNLLTDG
jgi:hypothetical protein